MKPFVLSIHKSLFHGGGLDKRDGDGERALLRELDAWIDGSNRPRVVIDCSELEVIGLPEIRFFISCLERVMKRNGDARIAGLSTRAREILSLSGVEWLFPIYDSRESAIRSFDTHPHFEIAVHNDYSASHEISGEGVSNIPRLQRASGWRKK